MFFTCIVVLNCYKINLRLLIYNVLQACTERKDFIPEVLNLITTVGVLHTIIKYFFGSSFTIKYKWGNIISPRYKKNSRVVVIIERGKERVFGHQLIPFPRSDLRSREISAGLLLMVNNYL